METWLEDMLESSALLGALLRVLHPEQYMAGMTALQAMADCPEVVRESEQIMRIL